MSILIKGLIMPSCCDGCTFSDWSNLHQTASCKLHDYDPCFADHSREYADKRADFCPLVEIPAHGRLIDADALIEVVEKSMAENPHKEKTQRAMHIHEHKYFLTLLAGIPIIQPEKAQLFSEGTTSDLISRTETVEHLRRVLDVTVPITDYDSGYVDGVEFGVSTVSTMPTIQPQSTTGQLNDSAQSTDLIDRQAVIDELRKFKPEIIPYEKARIYVEETVETMYDRIVELPTIHPETHEGRWIPHESPDGGEQYECSRCGVLWEFNDGTPEDNEAYFCPKCGAKMKGEANE